MKITLESISKATEKLAKENKELRQHLGEEEDLETLFGSEDDEEEDKEIDTTPADDEADEEPKDDEDKKPNPLAALKDVALDDDVVLGDGEEEEEKDLGDEDTVIDLGSSKEDDKEPEPEEEPEEEPEVKDDEPSDEEPEVEEPEEEEPFDVEDDPEEEEPGEVLDEPENDELADIELEPDVGDDDEDPEAAIDALELDGDEDDEVEEAGKRRGAVNPQVMDAFVDYESYLSELVGKHLEELWLNTKDEEDDFADYATKFLRGMLGYAAGKDTEVDAKVADRLVKQYLLSGGAAVDERHGEFKRNKFKKDKWNDGRKGRPRPDFKSAKPNKFDDDEVELDKVAEEDKVELSDLTADDIAAVKNMDKDAREELNDVKDGKERNEILQALGVGNAVKEDGEGNEKHTYAAYFDTSVPADVFAEGYSITTDQGDEYAVSVLSQITENEAGDFPLENVTKDGEDWYDEFNEILDKLMSEDRAYFADYDDSDIEWIGMEDDEEEEDDDEEVDKTSPVKQPEDPTDGKPEENIPPEFEVTEDDMEDTVPTQTTDIQSPIQLVEFIKESATFKKSPTLRKFTERYENLVKKSPKKAAAIMERLDKRFSGKPVKERRFCAAFIRAM